MDANGRGHYAEPPAYFRSAQSLLAGCGWLWQKIALPGSWALLAGGLLFWLVALLGASQLFLKQELSLLAGVLALTAASARGWRQAAARLAWWELDASKWLLWPVMLLMVLYQVSHQQILAAGWANLAGLSRCLPP